MAELNEQIHIEDHTMGVEEDEEPPPPVGSTVVFGVVPGLMHSHVASSSFNFGSVSTLRMFVH